MGARTPLRGRLGLRGSRRLISSSRVPDGRCGSATTRSSSCAATTANVRAFFNVCRHRGHELMPCGTTAKRAAIHCPYHGWTYAPDGRLRATPRFDPPPDFDPNDFGLVGVRAEEWHGWVMVNVSGDAVPLARGSVASKHSSRPMAARSSSSARRTTTSLAANWKLPIENYHECYHCPAIHPELCTVSPPASGDNYDLPGAWFGGTMDLAAHAETMSMSGKSPGRFPPRARRRLDGDRCCTPASSPTCSSACIPTT